MELKKCNRCGCFYMSDADICQNCMPKDRYEITKLKNYFENENCSNIVNSISVDTGISLKNLNRYLNSNEFSNITNNLNINL